ncbi:ZNF106 family protein [Megaselia abdita]
MSENQSESTSSRKKVPPFYRNPANNHNYHKERFNSNRFNYNDYNRYCQDNYIDRRDYNRNDQWNRRSRWNDLDHFRDRPRERSRYSSRSPEFNRSGIYRDFDRNDRRENNHNPKSLRSKSAGKEASKNLISSKDKPKSSEKLLSVNNKNSTTKHALITEEKCFKEQNISQEDTPIDKKTEESSLKIPGALSDEAISLNNSKTNVVADNFKLLLEQVVNLAEPKVKSAEFIVSKVESVVNAIVDTVNNSYPNISKHLESITKSKGSNSNSVRNSSSIIQRSLNPFKAVVKPDLSNSKPKFNDISSVAKATKPVENTANTATLNKNKKKGKAKPQWMVKYSNKKKPKNSQVKCKTVPKVNKTVSKTVHPAPQPSLKPESSLKIPPPTNDNSISSTTDFPKAQSPVTKTRSPFKNRIPTIPKSSLIFQKSSKFIPIEQYKRQFGITLVRKPFAVKKKAVEIEKSKDKEEPKQKESESEPQRPKIFLTPIAKLLKSPEELEQEKQNYIKENQPLSNGAPKDNPSILLNQVNKMDKDGLKNIINNPESKFSAALKLQARKRLSSELREKLRSLETEEKDCEGTPADFELHDDIIEASKLPPELLEELTKILGEDNMPETVSQKSETPPPLSKSPDLMSRIQTAEAAKSVRKSCENDPPVTSSSPKKNEELPQSYRNDNAVVINTSDSSSDEGEVAPLDKYELNSHNIIRKFKEDVLPLICTRVASKFNNIVTKDNDVKRALRFMLRFYLSNLTESENINGSLIKRLNRSINSKDKTFALDFLYRKTPKLIDRLEEINSKKLMKSIRRDSRKSNHHEISSTSTPMLTPEKNTSSTSSESSEQSTGLNNKIENEGDAKDNEITPSKKTDEFVIVADNTENEESSENEEPAITSSPSNLLNANLMELNNLKILTLMKENQISDVVLSNVKQLDAQIMETQHRKMYIEENILRLQKDKMEADLQIMRLQNEKFIILSTSLPKKEDFKHMQLPPPTVKKRRRTTSLKARTPPVSTNSKKRRTFSERSDEGGESSAVECIIPEEEAFSKLKEGCFVEHKSPIVMMEIVGDSILLAASEEGHVYKYNLHSKKLEGKFTKHTQTITQLMMYSKFFVITTSLDGHIKQTTIENFGLELQSIDVHEPIQSLDISWDIAFMGSRWGNVFTYNIKKNKLSQTLLCTIDSSVIALKCTTEGPRRILIVSSKGNGINFRDATSGLLLRSIEIPSDLYVNSLLLLGGYLYCGTQKNSIYKFYFSVS